MHGQRIGYVRVSSLDQNSERQLEHVQVDRLFTDQVSGKDTQRPELERLLALAKQRGAYRGRKKALSFERVAELRRRANAGEQKAKLAREFGISRETLYQYLRADA